MQRFKFCFVDIRCFFLPPYHRTARHSTSRSITGVGHFSDCSDCGFGAIAADSEREDDAEEDEGPGEGEVGGGVVGV